CSPGQVEDSRTHRPANTNVQNKTNANEQQPPALSARMFAGVPANDGRGRPGATRAPAPARRSEDLRVDLRSQPVSRASIHAQTRRTPVYPPGLVVLLRGKPSGRPANSHRYGFRPRSASMG